MKKKKKDTQFMVIACIVIGIILGVYIVQQQTIFFPKAAQPDPYQPGQVIENDTDLLNVSYELDDQNIEVIDNTLRQNEADVEKF